MTAVYAVPAWVCFVLVVGGSVGLSVALHTGIRTGFRSYDFIRHNEVAGFQVAVVAALYAVVLGFITVVVWQQYDASDDRNREEIGAVVTTNELTQVLPPQLRNAIQLDLHAYVDDVIDREFPAMQSGRSSQSALDHLLHAQRTIALLNRTDPGLNVVQAELLSHIDTVVDRRRTRLEDNDEGIGPLLWTALIVGAASVIVFSFLFGMENFRVQLVMTALIATVIGTMFVVILELDYPFRGDSGISSRVWVVARNQMSR